MSRPVLEVRISRAELVPALMAVCAGYEAKRWRADELSRDMFDRHLLSFATTFSQYSQIDGDSAAEGLRRAANAIYKTEKYGKRGEYGELLLHGIARDVFDSKPAISKIFFKDSANDTVKGFDAVHVVEAGSALELWLGEVKFYTDVKHAIRDVTSELKLHLAADFMRSEFVAIVNKLDDAWPHTPAIERLLDPNTSLDEIFSAITVPVLVTYESSAVQGHDNVCPEYVEALEVEARDAWSSFVEKCDLSWEVQLRLILLPLHEKKQLVDLMHERLRRWQDL